MIDIIQGWLFWEMKHKWVLSLLLTFDSNGLHFDGLIPDDLRKVGITLWDE